MKNTKELGNLTELQCITKLYELGCNISIPFGNSQKYDLIIDYNNQLYKIQIKHANEKDEGACFSIKTSWTTHNCTNCKQFLYSKEDIDYFATYYKENVYLIPIGECNGAEKIFRLKPPKNGQIKGINFAENYLAQEVLKKI